MNTVETISFQFEGKEYEIRVARSPDKIGVRVFLNGIPANPWTYSCSNESSHELEFVGKKSAWEYLVEHAKADVESRLLQKALEAEDELRKSGVRRDYVQYSATNGSVPRFWCEPISPARQL